MSLLPPNATPLERAIEAAGAARYPLPTDLPAAVLDPARCPAELLHLLAWHLSVDLWDDDWCEGQKREACRRAAELHRLKTSAAGIRAHVGLVGARVERIIRPPAAGILAGVQDEAGREAWLAGMPQIRIYPFFRRSFAVARSFATGPAARRQFHGQSWLRRSRGPQLLGRRATFYDNGAEFPVTLSEAEGGLVQRIAIGRTGARRMFHGRGHSRGFLTASTASLHVVTVRAGDDAARFAVQRGMEPVDVRPQRVALPRTAPVSRAFHGRSFHGRRFLRTSHAPLLVFDRIALHAADRVGPRRAVRSWHGRGRMGIPAFTAELRIAVPMRRDRLRSGRWHGAGYRKSADMKPLARAIAAVGASKAARDTILIDTTTHKPLRFGEFRFGEGLSFGQLRKVA